MAVLTQSATADNFLEVASLPEYADCAVELVAGEVVTMPVSNNQHAETLGELYFVISSFVRQHNLGRTLVGDTGFVLERNPYGRDTVRGVDLAFISKERAPEPLPPSIMDGAPDLAVEIMSPSNTMADIRRKINQMLVPGCPQVWIVHPDLREVDVHTNDGAKVFREGDKLSAGGILPGFEMDVADISQVNKPFARLHKVRRREPYEN